MTPITGAGRGMVVDIAKAALAAGNPVVATHRNPEAVTKVVGVDLGVGLFVIESVSPPYDFGALARWVPWRDDRNGKNALEQPND